MKLLNLTILAIFSSFPLFADGLPLNEDLTKYEAPHHLIQLNADQIEEVTVVGTLTLTREQWQKAREHEPATPKRIDMILPCNSNACFCSLDDVIFGVWFKNNTVAIVSLLGKKSFSQLDDEQKKEVATNIHLKMDEKGQFYESATLIPYDEVKARASYVMPSATKGDSLSVPSLFIEIPPASKASDTELAGRLLELQKIAKSTGRIFSVQWDTTGLDKHK